MTGENDNHDEDIANRGPSLSADGRLEGRFDRIEPSPAPSFKPPEEPPLEIQPIAARVYEPRVEQFREPVPPKRRAWPVKLAIATLFTLIATVAALFGHAHFARAPTPFGVTDPSILGRLNPGEVQPVIISSTPQGAWVSIAGQRVGQTPWAGENQWALGAEVTIEAPGYKTWKGRIDAGKPVTLDITLKK